MMKRWQVEFFSWCYDWEGSELIEMKVFLSQKVIECTFHCDASAASASSMASCLMILVLDESHHIHKHCCDLCHSTANKNPHFMVIKTRFMTFSIFLYFCFRSVFHYFSLLRKRLSLNLNLLGNLFNLFDIYMPFHRKALIFCLIRLFVTI